MEIREILRQIRAGESDHAIRRNLGVHRTHGEEVPGMGSRRGVVGRGPAAGGRTAKPVGGDVARCTRRPVRYRAWNPIARKWKNCVEEGVRISAIYARLQEQGFEGTYAAVQRFVHRLEPATGQRHGAGGARAGRRSAGGFWLCGVHAGRDRAAAQGMDVCDDAGLEPPPVRGVRVRPAGGHLAGPASSRV